MLNDTTQELSDEIGKKVSKKEITNICHTISYLYNYSHFSERQKAELLEKEAMQKTEALDYLNEQLAKAEQQNNEAKEKLRILDMRLQQMLLGIADIFKYLL